MKDIRAVLLAQQNLSYKRFQCRLMPTVDPDTVIGMPTPPLRALARQLKGQACAAAFLQALPHRYYEENNLHALLLAQIPAYDRCVRELNRFLPYVDNWATCDMLRPRCFRAHPDALLTDITGWLAASHTYTVRFGLEMLMTHFLDSTFHPRCLDMAAGVESGEYYVQMMVAWYFATALAKQWPQAIGYIEQRRLSRWVHNKAIQKAVESRRLTDAQKAYLNTLRWPARPETAG